MKAIYKTTSAGAESIPATKRDPHVSIDGKWRSFPKVLNLLQHVIAGTYYARCKLDGKPVRASLETYVFSVAKARLPDKLKELRKPKAAVGTFTDGRMQFEQQTKCDDALAELSKVYRLRCIEYLLRSWPEPELEPGRASARQGPQGIGRLGRYNRPRPRTPF